MRLKGFFGDLSACAITDNKVYQKCLVVHAVWFEVRRVFVTNVTGAQIYGSINIVDI